MKSGGLNTALTAKKTGWEARGSEEPLLFANVFDLIVGTSAGG